MESFSRDGLNSENLLARKVPLDNGRGVEPGSQVTEEHLRNMLGAMADPITGEPVGRVPNKGHKLAPVAGFDLTFSPPKSVSVAWAMADEGTKAIIYDCHRKAVEWVLAYGEREVFHSRSRTNGVVEEDVTGVIATAFTHWDSRAGDPQLHDHVVVWNRARSLSDGAWRTLDSRGLYRSVVALSKLHQGVLSDYLTEALGVGWEARSRRHSDRPRHEIEGVPETLLVEFSRRSDQVEARKDELIAAFAAAHGRRPSDVEVIRIRQRATIETRPDKVHRSLDQMTEGWRARATDHLGPVADQVAWVTGLKNRNDLPVLRAADLDEAILTDAAGAVVAAVAERRSTYTRQNLFGEAAAVLDGVRFASPDDRVAMVERITDLAIDASLTLTPPALHHTPQRYIRPDGSSRLRPESRKLYTTQALLDAEARLLEAGRRADGPVVPVGVVAAVAGEDLPGRDHTLSLDQALALEKIATSGRTLDVLVGPAGTGKSTTMAGLRATWEAHHGQGSVIGLAPSAAAAEVLADELGIDTENTAKWLTEWRRLPDLVTERYALAVRLASSASPLSAGSRGLRDRLEELDEDIDSRRLHAGQLVVIDEASLAGTFALDELVGAATEAGAKVLLVGDWAQLSAVEAGGAFSLLVRDRGDLVPELTDVRRFTASWEKRASVELRLGHPEAIEAYQAHGRITGGSREELIEALYQAWKEDVEAGKASLMIAPDAATVAELNRRARLDRVSQGLVGEAGLEVSGGQVAAVGDEVVTRKNNRLITTGSRWVKNGDRWAVIATNPDGSMALRRVGGHGEVVLPADYVEAHVELAYATTAHRAQGRSVDTAHVLVSPTTTREVAYVAATRGRESNRIYVDTHYDPDPDTGHDEVLKARTAEEVLGAVLTNEGADLSAHETLARAHHDAESFSTLHAEYQSLARAAQADRWESLLERCGLSQDQVDQVRSSEAHGPLLAAFRDAEARGLDVEEAFPALVRAKTLAGAGDPASVLHSRMDRWTRAASSRRKGADHLIAGLVPRALSVTDPDMARALCEREEAMESRARGLAELALSSGQVWVRRLGTPPDDPAARGAWLGAAATVAAYRERWGIGHDHRPLGAETELTTLEQAGDHKQAMLAYRRALALSRAGRGDRTTSERAVVVGAAGPETAGAVEEGVEL